MNKSKLLKTIEEARKTLLKTNDTIYWDEIFLYERIGERPTLAIVDHLFDRMLYFNISSKTWIILAMNYNAKFTKLKEVLTPFEQELYL